MKVTCVSASNVERAKNESASTYTCELIRDLLLEEHDQDLEVEIVRLIDYELTPCQMCGECFTAGKCVRDEGFNQVYSRLLEADAVFIVSPHYAPIPSKLVILFEKMEEMLYLKSVNDPHTISPLNRKPVGIIGHGGQLDESLSYYKSALLDPIATALMTVQMQVIGANERWPYGVAFGIKDLYKPEDSIFVKIEHDWDTIRERIRPLVKNVYHATQENLKKH